MRLVAHISDLHFGTEDRQIEKALLKELCAWRDLSLVLVSGDLTQRARSSQFRAARDFLDRLPVRHLVVPGNHDVPLYDMVRRFAAPLRRFATYINSDLDPFFEDAELAVLGLNTARSLTWKSGRISYAQIDLIRSTLAKVSSDKFKVVFTHHPFIPPPGESHAGIELVGRARAALPVLDQVGVDLLLAGHLHLGYSGDVRTFYPTARRSIIVAQAGTAISRRLRSEPNGYNLLRLSKDQIAIEVRRWDGAAFRAERDVEYCVVGSEWRLTALP